jgi:hypothetical protein
MVLIGTARAVLGPAPWALATPAVTSGAGALAEVPGLMAGMERDFTLADLRTF